MTEDRDNPFERYGIDPSEGPAGITEALRERMQNAESDDERRTLREVWESLTRHPQDRVQAALNAHPNASNIPVSPPPPMHRKRPILPPATLADLTLRPSLMDTLSLHPQPLPDVSFEEDPWLR